MTNEHVLGQAGQVAIGSAVMQPSIGDGGTPTADLVATLTATTPIDFGTTIINIQGAEIPIPNVNTVDAALARLNGGFNLGNREVYWIGYPAFTTREVSRNVVARMTRPVEKMGRTSEYTVGLVLDVSWDGFVDHSRLFGNPLGTNRAWFSDQLRILGITGPFSQPGDSGALILDANTKEPVGLLHSGSAPEGFATPIGDVMDALAIPRI